MQALDAIMKIMSVEKEYYPDEWDVSRENFKKILRGEASLRVAFITIWFIGGFLYYLAFSVFLGLFAQFESIEGFFQYFLANEEIFTIWYKIFACIVVWRNTICSKVHWLYIMRGLMLLVLYAYVSIIIKSI